jgi:hypothetical protein
MSAVIGGENSGSISLTLPEVSEEAALAFAENWYGGRDGWVVLTRIPAGARGVLKVESSAMQVGDIHERLREPLLQSMITDDRANWNAYISCSTHSENPTAGSRYKRGGKETVAGVHGVWLDLDVKDGAFKDGAECNELIRSMGIRPSIVVDSGSGGRHAYWKLQEPLSRERGEKLCAAWLARAREISGRHIDAVSTCDRIMRLPGTVRWPKEVGESLAPVSLIWNEGPLTTPDEVWRWSGAAWEAWNEKQRQTRGRLDEAWKLGNAELQHMLESDGWNVLLGLAAFEETFNQLVSWDDILVPHGWVCLGADSLGRRRWARPGQTGRALEKSAHTDYPDSPHVMALFSEDPATGLADMKTADIPLTKLRVHARLTYKDDVRALVADSVRGGLG